MRKIYRFLFLGILLQTSLLFAQINTVVVPKTSLFPSTGLSYMEDPGKYFSVILSNISGETQEVYLAFSISCDFSADGRSFRLETPNNIAPPQPLVLAPGQSKTLTQADFNMMLGHLNASSITMTGIDWQDVLMLPEGQYNICVTPYQWSQYVSSPMPAGERFCAPFSICYSGSAPEFVTPIVGQSAANLNNPNPTASADDFAAQGSSDNRYSSEYASIPLQQQLTFRWTGVVSNCLNMNQFRYVLKIVEVLPGQNVQDAIQTNSTLATIDNGSSLFYTYDTLRNRQFRLEKGHVYAAQVQAVLKAQYQNSVVSLGNEGKSQVITFKWGTGRTSFGPTARNLRPTQTSHTTDNRNEILHDMRNHYIFLPARDQMAIDDLTLRVPSEAAIVPADPNVSFEEEDGVKVYKLPVTEEFTAKWMPARSDSIVALDYTVYLYNYIGGDVEISTSSFQPILTEQITIINGGDYMTINHDPVEFEDYDWEDTLESGERYVMLVDANITYKYAKTTTFTKTDYVDGVPVTEDSSVVNILQDYTNFTSKMVFQWGIDSGALIRINPAQFTYPAHTYAADSTWTEIPEVLIDGDFNFTWNEPKGVYFDGISVLDTVKYDLFIHKLKNKQSIAAAIAADTLFHFEDLTEKTYINDTIVDSLKFGETYIAWIKTKIINNADEYLLENNGVSQYAIFKATDKNAFTANLDTKISCFPGRDSTLSKNIITPTVEELVKDEKEVKLGDFPLIMQEAELNKSKKTYKGSGYVIWNLYGIDCRVKVDFDSLQINDKYEVIKGSAKSAENDKTNYVQMDFGYGWSDWTDDKIDKLVSKYGDNDKVKEYYDEVNKYASYYDAIAGLWESGSMQTPVFTLPISIDDSKISNSENVKITIGEMFFSPNTALMNMLAIFNSNDDDMYIPLVATNICMAQDGFLTNVTEGIDLYLARNFEVDLKEGYTLRLRAADTLGKPANATYLSIDSKGFKSFSLTAELEFGPKFKKADMKQNGTVIPDKPVQARFSITLDSGWDDWVANVYMDPFAIAGAEDWTFVPTGKGIVIDHSSKTTPKSVKFPEGYDQKESDQWEGFYLDKFAVLLPDDISNTFTDIEGSALQTQDSMLVYNYGVNNSLVDSTHFYYNGHRITLAAEHLVIDSAGLSLDLTATDVIRAETDKAGGWAFALDTVLIRFVKNDFKFGSVVGGLRFPLLTGDMKYKCVLGLDTLAFSLTPKDTTFGMDLWAAKVNITPASSYFTVSKKKDENVKIDMTLNGNIAIDFNKFGIPVEITAVKFEKMTLRNFTEKEGATDSTKLEYDFDGFHFDAGRWSKASPQKRIGVYPPDLDYVDGMDATQAKPMFSGSAGGFSFNINTLKPIFEGKNSEGYYKAGLVFAGDISIGVGDCQSGKIGGGVGFKMWTMVRISDFDMKDFGGEIDSVSIVTDLDVFKLDGKVAFFRDDPNYGEGLRGVLAITIMDKVSLKMAAGFGSIPPTSEEAEDGYDWWFLEGVANCKPGIPLGPINLTGLGGGFAYNMEPKSSLANTDPRELRKAGNKGFENNLVSSGMEFIPKEDAWAAKAGIALALAEPDAMNADGYISLRVANGHFSGFMMQVNASVLTSYNEEKDENSNTTLTASAMIAVDDTEEKLFFAFSACVESEIDLSSFLKDAAGAVVPGGIEWPDLGSLSKGTASGDFLNPDILNIVGEEASDSETSVNTISAKMTMKIPIDLVVTHYKKGKSENTNSKDEWCFSIGRPPYDERVSFGFEADLFICKAKSDFTFYFITGNYFPDGFELPELPKEVKEFLGASLVEKAKQKRNIPKFEKAGGFAMGASFMAEIEFSLFLYVHVRAFLGFDVGLLKTNGQSCEGYTEMGKNGFYAIGQIYAMLEGEVGLSLDLGFWEGKLSLFEAGIGALLQGGGPRPTWCYGLLRFKAKLLGGMIKINTSVDFELGDVCVPGAGDPLANVKLFETITPSYNTVKDAQDSKKHINCLSSVIINSNMPWNEELILCSDYNMEGDPIDARKFKFIIWDEDVSLKTSPSTATSENAHNWSLVERNELKFQRAMNNSNVLYFETSSGGFDENLLHKARLVARAFEYRTHNPEFTNADDDLPYDLNSQRRIGVRKQNCETEMDWYDPSFAGDAKSFYTKPYIADTTIYFRTSSLPDNLDDQVLFTWPYNGDPYFPAGELVDNKVYIYMKRDREKLFNPDSLANEGKKLMAFLYDQASYTANSAQLIPPENITYSGGSPACLTIELPELSQEDKGHPIALQLFLVEEDAYNQKVNEQVLAQQQQLFVETHEVQGRDLLDIMSGEVTRNNTQDNSKAPTTQASQSSGRINRGSRESSGITRSSSAQRASTGGTITLGRSGGGVTTRAARQSAGNPTAQQAELASTRPVTLTVPGTVSTRGLIGRGSGNNLAAPQMDPQVLNTQINTQNLGPNLQNNLNNSQKMLNEVRITINSSSRPIVSKPVIGGKTPILLGGGSIGQVGTPSLPNVGAGRRPSLPGTPSISGQTGRLVFNSQMVIRDFNDKLLGNIQGSIAVEDVHLDLQNNRSPQLVLSGRDDSVVDLRQIRIDAAREEYFEEGADTMMDYKRVKINEYAIARQDGTTIYTLYFSFHPEYDTYEDMFRKMSSSVSHLPGDVNNTNFKNDIYTQELKYVNVNVKAEEFFKYAYLFSELNPDDKTMYMQGITLPPIANLVVDDDPNASDNEVIDMHHVYAKELDEFYESSQKLYTFNSYPKQSNTDLCYFDGWNKEEKDDEKIDMSDLKCSDLHWQKNQEGSKLLQMTYRQRDYSYDNVQIGLEGYSAPKIPEWWNCPTILDLSVQYRVDYRIDTSYFSGSGKQVSDNEKPTVEIIDRITYAMVDDIYKMKSFLQECHDVAVSYHFTGYCDCEKYFWNNQCKKGSDAAKKVARLTRSVDNPNAFISNSSFPFRLPELTRSLHYFYAWKFIHRPERYVLTGGKNPSLHPLSYKPNSTYVFQEPDKDTYYSLKDVNSNAGYDFPTYWFRYWLRSNGVPAQIEEQGIERALVRKEGAGDSRFNFLIEQNKWFTDVSKLSKTPPVTYFNIDIFYLSPRRDSRFFLDHCKKIAENIAQNKNDSENAGRIFHTTMKYELNWNFKMMKLNEQHHEKLNKNKKLEFHPAE